jgi:hypothetical protein
MPETDLDACPECDRPTAGLDVQAHADEHWPPKTLGERVTAKNAKAWVRRAWLLGEDAPKDALEDAYARDENARLKKLAA